MHELNGERDSTRTGPPACSAGVTRCRAVTIPARIHFAGACAALLALGPSASFAARPYVRGRAASGGGADAVITVNPSVTHQTITGWEISAQAGQDFSPAYDNYAAPLLDRAVNELGINRVRLAIRSGEENQEDFWQQWQDGLIPDRDAIGSWRDVRYSTLNDNADPFDLNLSGFQFSEMDFTIDKLVLPLKQRLEANGESLFVNVTYVAFTNQIGESGTPGLTYIHDDPQEYAEFVLATYLHLQSKYGWTPDSWEIFLEPDNAAEWDGTLIGQAIVAAAARLSANGFNPRFVAPSDTCMNNAIAYFDDLVAVPGAVQHVRELSYHRYCGVSDANLAAIASRAATYGLDTAMLEHIGSGHFDLMQDLTMGMNSAWQQFTLAWVTSGGAGDNGGNHYIVDDTDVANPTITLAWRSRFLRQYFKFVRAGAIRIDAGTNDTDFNPVAFTNANGTTVVVIAAERTGVLALQGLPPGTYRINFTTGSQFDQARPSQVIPAGGVLTTSIPESGVITVYALEDVEPPPPPDASVTAESSRYLSIVPPPGDGTRVAIQVRGESPAVACVSKYVQTDGTLGDTPIYKTQADWGGAMTDGFNDPADPTVYARGVELVAGESYEVRFDDDESNPGTSLSAPYPATLWLFGDTDNNRDRNITDIVRILTGFAGVFHSLSCTTDADCNLLAPYFTCDIRYGQCLWLKRENVDIIGVEGCRPDRDITIRDALHSIEGFQGLPNSCPIFCP